jgi:phosphoribosyl-AMP cyclohydrolase
MSVTLPRCQYVLDVEQSFVLDNLFWADGLTPCMTTDSADSAVSMVGWMNVKGLQPTIQPREAHCFSRTQVAVCPGGAAFGPTLTARQSDPVAVCGAALNPTIL